ncbi:GNAT family N-acetyltransferase [Egicoccus sp. AB-alg2]|uniref:GNAT family N-acetyltransferase n=1 Tax=Egicoccus sp. AB-alg2 TaxID=3242693 RepID=UPI00359DB8D6
MEDPRLVLDVFARDRDVHPYGIADVQQLWDVSRWWVAGDAVAGRIDLPGSHVPVVYAVAARDPAATLDLLAELQAAGVLADHYVVTGPRGLTARLRGVRRPRWSTDYVKMALRHLDRLPAADVEVDVLGRDDLPALRTLYATDATPGTFFHDALVDTGCYVGLRDGDRIVASAGVHVVDRVNGVAALGNVLTAAGHRGRGLGRRVTATLCRRLLAQVDTVGLNVAADNTAAHRLYAGLGFVDVLPYEEAELVSDSALA